MRVVVLIARCQIPFPRLRIPGDGGLKRASLQAEQVTPAAHARTEHILNLRLPTAEHPSHGVPARFPVHDLVSLSQHLIVEALCGEGNARSSGVALDGVNLRDAL